MLSKMIVRWAIVIPMLVLLLATPKPAFAGADCGAMYQYYGSGYQGNGNCYGYPPANNNCNGYQDGNNCNGYQGNTNNCNGYPGGTNGCQPMASCTVNQNGGYGYASYGMQPSGTYVVQWGDTMRIIADRMGIPLTNLIAANPQIWNPSLIYVGQVICLPTAYSQPSSYQQGPNPNPPGYYQQGQNPLPPAYNNYYGHHPDDDRDHRRVQSNLYTIQPGDTLKSIAKKFNTTVDDLLKLNPSLHGVPGRIHVGLVIALW